MTPEMARQRHEYFRRKRQQALEAGDLDTAKRLAEKLPALREAGGMRCPNGWRKARRVGGPRVVPAPPRSP